MTSDDLENIFRSKVQDDIHPYQFTSVQFHVALNDAINEACKRKPALLFDKTTAEVCEISFAIADQVKPLHESILEIVSAYLVDDAGSYHSLVDLDKIELEYQEPNWRENTNPPSRYMVEDTTIELDTPADVAYTMYLEVYRLPLLTAEGSSPEISGIHHTNLIDWILREYYDVRDADQFSPELSAKHEQRFTDYFGERPRATTKRKSWTNRPQHNKVW